MAEVIKSSFIPKKEIQTRKSRGSGSNVNLFFLISLIIFLSTILGAVGLYFYKKQLTKEKNDNVAKFKRLKSENTIDTFQKFFKFDRLLKNANTIILNHYYVLPVFNFLEVNTLTSIYFTEMDLKENGDYIEFSFKGMAEKFSDIVIQKEKYTKNPNIEDFMFLNIDTDKDGNKVFDMTFKVNKKYLSTKVLDKNLINRNNN